MRFLPKIIEFLGYDPNGAREPESWAKRLKAHRTKLGLSRKKLAAQIRTDESNLEGWETGKHQPTKETLERIDEFLSWTAAPER